jgi:hypothetical protein
MLKLQQKKESSWIKIPEEFLLRPNGDKISCIAWSMLSTQIWKGNI